MLVDRRYAIYITPAMLVLFVGLGFLADWPDWQKGLAHNYALVSNIPAIIAIMGIWLVNILIVIWLWHQPSRPRVPKRRSARRWRARS